MTEMELYRRWADYDLEDPDLKAELQEIAEMKKRSKTGFTGIWRSALPVCAGSLALAPTG